MSSDRNNNKSEHLYIEVNKQFTFIDKQLRWFWFFIFPSLLQKIVDLPVNGRNRKWSESKLKAWIIKSCWRGDGQSFFLIGEEVRRGSASSKGWWGIEVRGLFKVSGCSSISLISRDLCRNISPWLTGYPCWLRLAIITKSSMPGVRQIEQLDVYE